MFKLIATLVRGQSAAAEQALADRHALLLLDQQMREVMAHYQGMQRALALADTQQSEEARVQQATLARIEALEGRARAAIAAGQIDLATEAAAAIAALEADHDAGTAARAQFATELVRLRRETEAARLRLAALHRGRRTAHVAEAARVARRGRTDAPHDRATLAEAEATLARLRTLQAQDAAIPDTPDETVDERLAAAGFGPALRPTAASVLARLTQEPAP